MKKTPSAPKSSMQQTGQRIQSHSVPAQAGSTRQFAPPVSLSDTAGQTRPTHSLPGWLLLPLRLFLGITFIYAGVQKLTDPQYFKPSAAGFVGKQITSFAVGSPLHDFLMHVAVPHAAFFGTLVAYGELAIGVGALLGLLLRPAAFFGMLISLVFFLSASWRVRPYFYGADIVFVFSWLTMFLAGPRGSWLPSVDALLASRLLRSTVPEKRAGLARLLCLLLGVGEGEQAPVALADQVTGKLSPRTQNTRRMVGRQQSRRDFVGGLITGGLATLGVVWFFERLIRSADQGSLPSSTTSPQQGNGANGGAGSGTPNNSGTASTTTTIAVASKVPANSAVTFTIPSSGDPGVLIHLSNGQFVAYDAVCTHAGCPVDYDSSSQHLLCPCHGAEFDPARAAAVVAGPTDQPLPKVAIHVDSATGAITLA
ncbi:MAG: DoxX family membrane protein [Chloroflexota bacterium]|nr:DoxX family membrane protein [Chloroflexota bacterium]